MIAAPRGGVRNSKEGGLEAVCLFSLGGEGEKGRVIELDFAGDAMMEVRTKAAHYVRR